MEIDLDSLPRDPGALRCIIASLLEDRETRDRRIRQMQHMLEQLLRHRYGPRRERINENQLFLFAVKVLKAEQDRCPPKEKTRSDKPKAKGHGRRRLPKTLERKRVVFDLAEHERHCPDCRGELKHIGEEVSERLEYVPALFYVIEEVSHKYACK
jgi:hypothetical protein